MKLYTRESNPVNEMKIAIKIIFIYYFNHAILYIFYILTQLHIKLD